MEKLVTSTLPQSGAPAWPPVATPQVKWDRNRMGFACSSCLNPFDNALHRSCEHVALYLKECIDLDDEGSRTRIAYYTSADRPRAMWLPLAINVEMLCVVTKVSTTEVGLPYRDRRLQSLQGLEWPDDGRETVWPSSPEWAYEIQDLGTSIAIRRRTSLNQRDPRSDVHIMSSGNKQEPVLLDPFDSFLKFVRIMRNVYSSHNVYAEAMERLTERKRLDCPGTGHKIKQDEMLRDDIKEISKRLLGELGGVAYDMWRRGSSTEGAFNPVLMEVAMAHAYSVATDEKCMQCARSMLAPGSMPDFAVPKL